MSGKITAVDRPILVTIGFSLLVLLGGYMAFQLPIALYPSISVPEVVVYTSYPNAGPETVEKTVTKVLEESLSNVNGIKKMTSTSSTGSSEISIQFDYGMSIDAATNDVRDKLGALDSDLPGAAKKPQIYKFDPSSMPILTIAVKSARGADEARKLAVDRVAKEILRINGVSQASVQGGRTAVVRVDVSQERLDAFGLTLGSISSALAAQSMELGGGAIAENGRNFSVLTTGEFGSVGELASCVVAQRGGYGVKLGDVAEVKLDYRDEDSSVIINGESGVYVSVQKRSGGNTAKIAREVVGALPEIQKKLPPDVKLVVISDDSEQVSSTVATLVRSAFEAIVFAMLVIFLFLRSFKTTLIIGLSIPISIATTLLVMYFMGMSLNIYTMTGLILGVGMIVDDSIVIMENIVRYRDRGMKNRIAAIIGSAEMRQAVVASTLTTIFVFVPFLIFKNKLDMIGILFQDMLVTIVLSLLSSLAVALFLVPVLISRYFPLPSREEAAARSRLAVGTDRIMAFAYDRLALAYRRALGAALRHRAAVVSAIAMALALSVGLVPTLKFEFSPTSEGRSVTLNAALPVGSTIEETKALLARLEAIVRSEVKGYQSIISTAGSGGSGDFSSSSGTYKGSIQVILPPKDRQIDGSEAIKSVLRRHYGDFPAVKFTLAANQDEMVSGSSAAIDIVLSSDDLEAAIFTAQRMVETIKSKVPEATEVAMDMNTGLPQVKVAIDRKKAYALGVDVASIASEVSASVAGIVSTQYHQGGGDYDVLIILRQSDRQKVIDLNRIYVASSSGARVSLASVASLVKGTAPLSIARLNKARVIHVTANASPGVSVPALEQKVRNAISAGVSVDPSVSLSYAGDLAAMVNTGRTMLVVIVMAIILIFGVMAGQYESMKDPLINLFTIPLMVIGVVLIYFVSGQSVSMFTVLGLLMLVGIVVKNGIVMVDYTNLLRERGMGVGEACLEAGVTRLRPVLMTSLTAILGMIPLAFNSGQGGEMVKPIGLTVIGGLTSSTLMTLFLIPVIYSLFNKDIVEVRDEAV